MNSQSEMRSGLEAEATKLGLNLWMGSRAYSLCYENFNLTKVHIILIGSALIVTQQKIFLLHHSNKSL